MHVLQVLKRPVITEKSTLLQEQNKYVFDILQGANKAQVREAVERGFEVSVKSVNIISQNTERVRRGNGRWQTRKSNKKAVVTLAPGDSIQLFEGA
jgi:large subunit ribosomal protein L23